MNANIVKSKLPIVTKRKLKRTPASAENLELVKFIDSHIFSFSINKDSKELRSSVIPSSDLLEIKRRANL